ncbi:hypothetical protein C8J57DRAFT_36910 [Mycena rebaudengoi]|nr:hypothetical protein C8J57DRAFT_36910 [Mycena rebaudengoi]
MPDLEHRIDVTNPLIQYDEHWIAGPDPQQARQDSKGTYVVCGLPEDGRGGPGPLCSVTLIFIGKEIHVVGALRTHSAPYQVELDGETFGPFPPSKNDQFRIDLFSKTGLASEKHTLTLSVLPPARSQDASGVDLYEFTWTSNVASLSDARVQDDSAAFVYTPEGAWNTDLRNLPGFDDGNGHITLTQSTATFTFSGDRVALYGSTGHPGGPFTAQIDAGAVLTLTTQENPVFPYYFPNQLLFYADGLPSGNHILKLVAAPQSATQGLSIDYAIVDASARADISPSAPTSSPSSPGGVVSPPSSTALGPSSSGGILRPPSSHSSASTPAASPFSGSGSSGDITPPTSSGRHSKLSSAQIGGTVAGTVLLLLLLSGVIFYLRRRRSLRHLSTSSAATVTQFPPDLVTISQMSTTVPTHSKTANDIANTTRNTIASEPPNYATLFGDYRGSRLIDDL